jgi:hypothetical protein
VTAAAAKVEFAKRAAAYPEFNMFGKTMPAYGIYARPARGLKLLDVKTSVIKPDARPETVFVDVEDVRSGK